jgi:hypothetical protein
MITKTFIPKSGAKPFMIMESDQAPLRAGCHRRDTLT